MQEEEKNGRSQSQIVAEASAGRIDEWENNEGNCILDWYNLLIVSNIHELIDLDRNYSKLEFLQMLPP